MLSSSSAQPTLTARLSMLACALLTALAVCSPVAARSVRNRARSDVSSSSPHAASADALLFRRGHARLLAPHSLDGFFGVGSFVSQRSNDVSHLMVGRIRLLGAKWVREEFTATRLHRSTNGPYFWSDYDQVVDEERAAGLHILGLLDYSNTWGLGDHGTMPHAAMPRLIDDFARYAYAVARHFRGRIRYWQVWNEPDLVTFWHPYPNADDYARLLDAASRAIKRANPRARVVVAGLSKMDIPFLQEVARRTSRFDVVAVHPYRLIPEPELLDGIRRLRTLGRPVWFSEIGWAAGDGCYACTDEEDQARFLVRFYTLAAAAGVQRVFWYDLRDDQHTPASPEGHFGLMRQDLSGKPAFAAFAFLARLLRHASFLWPDALGPQLYALRFFSTDGPTDVVWNAGGGAMPISLRWPDARATLLGMDGREFDMMFRRHGRITFELGSGGGPLYVVGRRAGPAMVPPRALLRLPSRTNARGRRSLPSRGGAWLVRSHRPPATHPSTPHEGGIRRHRRRAPARPPAVVAGTPPVPAMPPPTATTVPTDAPTATPSPTATDDPPPTATPMVATAFPLPEADRP